MSIKSSQIYYESRGNQLYHSTRFNYFYSNYVHSFGLFSTFFTTSFSPLFSTSFDTLPSDFWSCFWEAGAGASPWFVTGGKRLWLADFSLAIGLSLGYVSGWCSSSSFCFFTRLFHQHLELNRQMIRAMKTVTRRVTRTRMMMMNLKILILLFLNKTLKLTFP